MISPEQLGRMKAAIRADVQAIMRDEIEPSLLATAEATKTENWRHWTASEDDIVLRMRQAGSTFYEIGQALDRTMEAIKCRWYHTLRARAEMLLAERAS